MERTSLYSLLLISYLLSGCSLLESLTEDEGHKTKREEMKMLVVLDRPDAEAVLDRLEHQFVQVYNKEGLEELEALVNAKKEVRKEVQLLMAVSLKNPAVAKSDSWIENKSATLQKRFTETPQSLCEACAFSLGELLVILSESLLHPLPSVDKQKIKQRIKAALKQPDAKQLLDRAEEVRIHLYTACNPDMEIEVAKYFSRQDVYEKLGYVVEVYTDTANPKYIRRFCNDKSAHLQNLQQAFSEASYKLCKTYVDCWDGLQAIMTEAHGGFYEK